MLAKLLDNFRHPKVFAGALIARMMNVGHGAMTDQVLRHLAIGNGDIVLDVGCGGGGAIAKMAARGATVYGVDFSPTSVRIALHKNRVAVNKGKVCVEVASVDGLPFEENRFDWVTAFETVYFWKNIQDNFSHIFRLLKPGGRFAIAVEVYKEGGKNVNMPPSFFDSLNLALYSAEEMEAFAKNAGFGECVSFKGGKRGWLCFCCQKPYSGK